MNPTQSKMINKEMACLSLIIEKHRQPSDTQCVIYAMSDQPETIAELESQIPQLIVNCTLSTVVEHPQQYGVEFEHGPWAGLGFYQDLMHTAQARNAAVISRGSSTSSWMMIELIEYNYNCIVKMVQRGESLGMLHKLPICYQRK